MEILDRSLLTSGSTPANPILGFRKLVIFPQSRHMALREFFGSEVLPHGVWHVMSATGANKYNLRRLLTASHQAPIGEVVSLPMSAILGNAKASSFGKTIARVGRRGLSGSRLPYLQFIKPEESKQVDETNLSPIGIWEIISQSGTTCQLSRIATWNKEKAPLGESGAVAREAVEAKMGRVDMFELGC